MRDEQKATRKVAGGFLWISWLLNSGFVLRRFGCSSFVPLCIRPFSVTKLKIKYPSSNLLLYKKMLKDSKEPR
jgi:hypothetical protein